VDAPGTSRPPCDDLKIGSFVVHLVIPAVPEPPTVLTHLQEQKVSFG
jgi:hypothetical protein